VSLIDKAAYLLLHCKLCTAGWQGLIPGFRLKETNETWQILIWTIIQECIIIFLINYITQFALYMLTYKPWFRNRKYSKSLTNSQYGLWDSKYLSSYSGGKNILDFIINDPKESYEYKEEFYKSASAIESMPFFVSNCASKLVLNIILMLNPFLGYSKFVDISSLFLIFPLCIIKEANEETWCYYKDISTSFGKQVQKEDQLYLPGMILISMFSAVVLFPLFTAAEVINQSVQAVLEIPRALFEDIIDLYNWCSKDGYNKHADAIGVDLHENRNEITQPLTMVERLRRDKDTPQSLMA
jgi:hypothetical protein